MAYDFARTTLKSAPTRQAVRSERGVSLTEMLFIVAILGLIGSIAISPALGTVRSIRVRRDSGGIANYVALAKIRAASGFTRARIYADLSAQTFALQLWQKASNSWVTEGGAQHLSTGVSFGFGSVATPPPNTQPSIGQASACRDSSNTTIANTGCIVFNSRGLPIDSTGAPVSNYALYVTNAIEVHGVTVSPGGMTQTWVTGVNNVSWMNR